MSITDELRKWAEGSTLSSWTTEHLTAIADRIDEAHQKAEDEWKAKDGQSWLHGYVECHTELMEGNEAIAASLEEAGWVRLPVDADGEYIHIGDEVEWCDSGETLTVEGIGSDVLFYIDGENAEWTAARNKRHHHEPTVEDVLRDVVTLCHNTWKEESPFHFYDVDDVMKSGNIAASAAKLRLAGDAE